MRFFCALMLALAFTACRGGDRDAQPVDTTGAASAESGEPMDTIRAESSAPDSAPGTRGFPDDRRPSGAQPPSGAEPPTRDESQNGSEADDAPVEQDATTPRPSLAARYQLAYVDGEALPVTIDENPDCKVELVDGDLRIRDDGSFDLRASSRTTCGGEPISDDVRTAEGTVDRSGDRLRFEATSGEFFATAMGTFTTEGQIDVDGLDLGGEVTPVDWRFVR